MEPAALAAGDSGGADGDGAWRTELDVVEHAARDRRREVNTWNDMTYDEAIKHFDTQLGDNFKDIVDLLRLTAGGNECSYAAKGASEIERLREVVTACHQALFQAQQAAKVLLAKGEMLAAVVQGAQEEFVRVPYGASHEDVAAINDWHKMAAEALSEWENKA